MASPPGCHGRMGAVREAHTWPGERLSRPGLHPLPLPSPDCDVARGGSLLMPYEDKTQSCVDCSAEFQLTASEQEFYNAKGFQEPRRCPACRADRRSHRYDEGQERLSYPVVCAQCGVETESRSGPAATGRPTAKAATPRSGPPACRRPSQDTTALRWPSLPALKGR